MKKTRTITAFLTLLIPGIALGQIEISAPRISDANLNFNIPSPLTAITLEQGLGLLSLVLHTAYILFFIIAALMIILTALDYMRSGGNNDKVRAAQSKLIYVIIAVAIALLSSAASGFIRNILERTSQG